MSGANHVRSSVAALAGLLVACACGGEASPQVADRSALDLSTDLPVASSFSGSSFSATFSGDDADLSFVVDTGSTSGSVTGGGWITLTPGGGKGSFGIFAGALGCVPAVVRDTVAQDAGAPMGAGEARLG